ncbi:MAG TPA: hypothetical protein HPP76_00220 [Desulfuromonadales bacterium]|nr:hypothetical protein [Desulfuromonadales bacterium]
MRYVLLVLVALSVAGCGGGDSNGNGSLTVTPSSTGVSLVAFKNVYYGTTAGPQFSFVLGGSDSLGCSWSGSYTMVADGPTTINSNGTPLYVTRQRAQTTLQLVSGNALNCPDDVTAGLTTKSFKEYLDKSSEAKTKRRLTDFSTSYFRVDSTRRLDWMVLNSSVLFEPLLQTALPVGSNNSIVSNTGDLYVSLLPSTQTVTSVAGEQVSVPVQQVMPDDAKVGDSGKLASLIFTDSNTNLVTTIDTTWLLRSDFNGALQLEVTSIEKTGLASVNTDVYTYTYYLGKTGAPEKVVFNKYKTLYGVPTGRSVTLSGTRAM